MRIGYSSVNCLSLTVPQQSWSLCNEIHRQDGSCSNFVRGAEADNREGGGGDEIEKWEGGGGTVEW